MQKKSSPIALTILTIILVIGVIVGAAFQEQIGFYIRLKGWDPEAPTRTVVGLLDAMKKGDQAGTMKFVGSSELKPLEKDGKFVGLQLQSIAGTIHFVGSSLAPADGAKPSATEYSYIGEGSATVKVADSAGKQVPYRLKMRDGEWKVVEILGGDAAP